MTLEFDQQRFLQSDWQRRPALLRGALPGFVSPISGDDLAGLAAEPAALARLVSRRGQRWKLRHGPFGAADYAALPPRNWTLLVQDVDKWLPEAVGVLLEHFAFLPRWRLEDLMVSFAVKGGSVGAHVDQYDVFLLQASGRRRWQIDCRAQTDRTLQSGVPLKLLQRFAPTHDWVLEPGDILYLPPGVPHHGIALDPCLTFSIGLRAPAAAELLQALASETLELDPEGLRYRDRGMEPARMAGELDRAALKRMRQVMRKLIDDTPDAQLAQAMGRFICAHRSPRALQPPRLVLRLATLARRLVSRQWELVGSPWHRLCWTRKGKQALLHNAESSITVSRELASALCDGGVLDAVAWQQLTATEQQGFWQFYAVGALLLQRR